MTRGLAQPELSAGGVWAAENVGEPLVSRYYGRTFRS